MKLGDFRAQTAHLPDNAEMVFPNYIDTYKTVQRIVIAETLVCTDMVDSRIYSDLGVSLPADEYFPTIIIDTIN